MIPTTKFTLLKNFMNYKSNGTLGGGDEGEKLNKIKRIEGPH